MSLPKTSRKPDPIEQDFENALQRLVNGQPKHKTLKARAKAGKLKINISNVALEAGRSRTLIALENSRYPKVREAIMLAQGGEKAHPKTFTQLTENLRATIAELKVEKRLLEKKMATHVLARRKAEVSAERDQAEAARLRKQMRELEKIAHLPHRESEIPRLVLIRGLPGSGKTTKATGYANDGYLHLEADQFFMIDGEYHFNVEKLPEAHAWCLDQARKGLDAGEFVCVANVFSSVEDVKPYTQLGFDYQLVEATYPGHSIHKVSVAVLHAMKATWVPTDRLVEALQVKSHAKASVTSITSKKRKN
ncbi:MAG: hypothetical protein B7X29_05775 [Halothiobacillus sp. 13-55-115]|jgi:hypothetical protein|nr:MAG: hypothetical protein B7X29_05775 [Halothiobacillus sp. 13-55-115]